MKRKNSKRNLEGSVSIRNKTLEYPKMIEMKWNECIMQEIIFFTRNFLSKTWSRRKHEYKSVLYLIMNKTISVQSFLIRSKFVFQKIDDKSCFVVNSVYTNNILNLMYKPFDCLREVMAFFSTNLELLCSGLIRVPLHLFL